MNHEKIILEKINSISGEYPAETIFGDWVECMAISWQNATMIIHDRIWQQREERYLQIVKKYKREVAQEFSDMHALLVLAMEKEVTDVLGQIYMNIECSNKKLGQFFTPFHVSKLTSDLSAIGADGSRTIEVNEPSCGSGGMIIAFAKTLLEKGLNYQKLMRVTAQDLDWRSVFMTYVQMCILGIDAKVMQMNTLLREQKAQETCVLYTPRRMGVIF